MSDERWEEIVKECRHNEEEERMNDLITRSDDERLDGHKCGSCGGLVTKKDWNAIGLRSPKCPCGCFPNWVVAPLLHRDSLRASLQREEAERAERDEMKVERDVAVLRAEKAERVVARIEVEGLRKAILSAMRPYHGIISAEEAATDIRDYLLEGK